MVRRLGTLLVAAGLLLLAYAASVLLWRDPVTDVYTAYQQHELRGRLHEARIGWQRRVTKELARRPTRTVAAERASMRALALAFAREERGHDGRALGKIVLPPIGVSEVFVEGTDSWS